MLLKGEEEKWLGGSNEVSWYSLLGCKESETELKVKEVKMN